MFNKSQIKEINIKLSIDNIILNTHSTKKINKYKIDLKEKFKNIKTLNIYLLKQNISKSRVVGNNFKGIFEISNNNKKYYAVCNLYVMNINKKKNKKYDKTIFIKVFTILTYEQLLISYNFDFGTHLNLQLKVGIKQYNNISDLFITDNNYECIKNYKGICIYTNVTKTNNNVKEIDFIFDTKSIDSIFIDYIWYFINIKLKKYKKQIENSIKTDIKIIKRYIIINKDDFIKLKKNNKLINLPRKIKKEDVFLLQYGIIKNDNKKFFYGKNILIYVVHYKGQNNEQRKIKMI